MNARTVPAGQAKAAAAPPRFDAKFIEEHKLIERYLENKLPLKGARDLENWCRAHPEYLDELKLSERAQASLKLLEASGHAVDLGEPEQPMVEVARTYSSHWPPSRFVSLLAFWTLVGKYSLLRSELEDAKLRATPGPAGAAGGADVEQHVSPDRAAGHRSRPHPR